MFLPAQQLQAVLQITVHLSTPLQMGCKWKVNKVDDFTATRGVPHGLIVSVEDVEARTRTRIQFQFFLLIKCSCFTWFVRCHLCVMQRYETENVRLYTLVPNRIGKSVHLPESIHFLITISFVQIVKSDSFRCTRLSLFWIGRVFALYAAARHCQWNEYIVWRVSVSAHAKSGRNGKRGTRVELIGCTRNQTLVTRNS